MYNKGESGHPYQIDLVSWMGLVSLPWIIITEDAILWMALSILMKYGPKSICSSNQYRQPQSRQLNALIVSTLSRMKFSVSIFALWSTSLVSSRAVWMEHPDRKACCCSKMYPWNILLILNWNSLVRILRAQLSSASPLLLVINSWSPFFGRRTINPSINCGWRDPSWRPCYSTRKEELQFFPRLPKRIPPRFHLFLAFCFLTIAQQPPTIPILKLASPFPVVLHHGFGVRQLSPPTESLLRM